MTLKRQLLAGISPLPHAVMQEQANYSSVAEFEGPQQCWTQGMERKGARWCVGQIGEEEDVGTFFSSRVVSRLTPDGRVRRQGSISQNSITKQNGQNGMNPAVGSNCLLQPAPPSPHQHHFAGIVLCFFF